MVKFLKWRALYKLGGLPDACQGLGDKRAGLLGRWRLIPPALDRFGHDRMAGGVIAFRGPLGGMGVGDGGAGLLDGGHGPAVSCQAAEVDGDCLGFCGQ